MENIDYQTIILAVIGTGVLTIIVQYFFPSLDVRAKARSSRIDNMQSILDSYQKALDERDEKSRARESRMQEMQKQIDGLMQQVRDANATIHSMKLQVANLTQQLEYERSNTMTLTPYSKMIAQVYFMAIEAGNDEIVEHIKSFADSRSMLQADIAREL